MAYNYPYGNGQQLNLDWFLNEWKNLLAAWEAEKNGIEGALQAEIDRAEAALADVFAARDAAAQSAANALESKNAAAQSATDASGYLATVRADANTASNAAQNAAQSESNAAESAQTALASKNAAGQSERNAAQSEANANSSKNAAAQSAADALANKDAAAQSAADALANKDAAAQSAEDAENAAASVEASAQQIATNTSDISILKESTNELKTAVTQLDDAVYGEVDNTFPLTFENGTYYSTANGQPLEKYYGSGYDKTRKVVKTTVFNAPCNVIIKAKTGYSFTVFTSENGVITGNSGLVTEYTMLSGQQYGMTLRTTGGTDDISSVDASQIVDIQYASIIDGLMAEDKIGLSAYGWKDSYVIGSTNYAGPAGNKENFQGRELSGSNVVKASPFIPLSGKMLQLPMIWTANTTFPNFGMSLYDKNKNPIYGRAVSALPNKTSDYYAWVNVYIPENAKYFRTTYWADTYREQYPDDIPEFTYNLLKEIPDEYKPITHELPVDTYMQNAIRRARQLTDIKWTPRVNIARYSMMYGGDLHFLDWFYADHEYVGIPYSGAGGDESQWSSIKDWGYTHNWVGQHIPIDAFVTAARYPNSIMGETASRTQVSYDASPYGDVCTALVNYAVDGPTPLRSISGFFNTSDNVFRYTEKTVNTISKNDIAIGDFLYTSAHVIIITDIMRDSDGNVIAVEMSEETTVGNGNNSLLGTKYGGVARRKMWDADEWKTRYSAYRVYRRTTFYGISYTPSRYVDTGNEGNRETIQDYPCIPYLGNTAVYKVGYIHNSKVLIGATGYTTLVVNKDGAEFGTFDVTGLTEVSVGFSAAGEYEAYLTNGNSRTIACTWTVEA